jgi:uncharacterized protein (DUF2252 family)
MSSNRALTCFRGRSRDDDLSSREVRKQFDRIAGCRLLDERLQFAGATAVCRTRQRGKTKKNNLCLIDIKEAVQAAAPRAEEQSMPRDHASRVVEGARHLSPYLGKRMLAAKLLGVAPVRPELLPQDLKLEMDRLTREEIVASAKYLASVVGKAHTRQMDAIPLSAATLSSRSRDA